MFWSRLGLKKIKVSVSSRTKNRRSRSRLSLRPQRLILQAHFQRQKFTKVSTTNRLSVGLYSTACHSHSLCFYAIDSLIIIIGLTLATGDYSWIWPVSDRNVLVTSRLLSSSLADIGSSPLR